MNVLYALWYLQGKRKMLVKWAKDRLILENHQPSVRYQIEWLLVRLLSTMPDELEDFWNLFSKVRFFKILIKSIMLCINIFYLAHVKTYLVLKFLTGQ